MGLFVIVSIKVGVTSDTAGFDGCDDDDSSIVLLGKLVPRSMATDGAGVGGRVVVVGLALVGVNGEASTVVNERTGLLVGCISIAEKGSIVCGFGSMGVNCVVPKGADVGIVAGFCVALISEGADVGIADGIFVALELFFSNFFPRFEVIVLFDFFDFFDRFLNCLLFVDDRFDMFFGSGGNCTFGKTDSMK